MKVIFLDVDGVLNSDEFFDNNKDNSYIDEKTVRLLKKAVEETGAKVVVSSSFRYTRSFGKVQEILLRNGITFDKTPFLDNERGKEIKQWIAEHSKISEELKDGSEVEDYVVLDDDIFDDFDEEILSHLIKMEENEVRGFGKGLQEKDVEKIIERFGRARNIVIEEER